jgi:hypothetical protein
MDARQIENIRSLLSEAARPRPGLKMRNPDRVDVLRNKFCSTRSQLYRSRLFWFGRQVESFDSDFFSGEGLKLNENEENRVQNP